MTGTDPSTSPSAGSDELVWYAAYGSNVLAARFGAYLAGGPVPGSTVGDVQVGSRRSAPPVESDQLTIDHELLFARRSTRWGDGGVAFVAPEPTRGARTHCRLWAITLDQMEDVFAQENRQPEPPVIDLDQLRRVGCIEQLESAYGTLLHLGEHAGRCVLTFTSDQRDSTRPAHQSYLLVIAAGLIEMGWTDHADIARYLAERPGNLGAVDPVELEAIIARL